MIAERAGVTPSDITLNQAVDFIKLDWKKYATGIYGEVHKVEFYVKESEAKKMIKWWEERYKHMKVYSVFPWKGEQCTTAVKSAIQDAFPLQYLGNSINYIPDDTQKPSGLLLELKKIISTSRKHAKQPAKESILKTESKNFP